MYTIKIVVLKEDGKSNGFPNYTEDYTHFIEGRRARFIKALPEEKKTADDLTMEIKEKHRVGEAAILNHNEDARSVALVSYFDEKGEYRNLFVHEHARIYLLNSNGKTVDKIIV